MKKKHMLSNCSVADHGMPVQFSKGVAKPAGFNLSLVLKGRGLQFPVTSSVSSLRVPPHGVRNASNKP